MKSTNASFELRTGFTTHLLLCSALLAVAISGGRCMQTAHAATTPMAIQQPTLVVISAASYTEPVAPDSIAAIFGQKLATRIEVANTVPLPTALAGTTVTVDGKTAMLFFVSPGQINFLMPAETRIGRVDVVVRSGDGTVSQGTVQVQNTAPGVFTQNADGKGVPAAQLIRVRNGVQTTELPHQFVNGRFITKPIDLGPPGDQVVLVLYLTGLRRATDPIQSVKVVTAGQPLQVDYAGIAPGLTGLDQINVTLPRELANRGIVNFTVTIPGAVASNAFDLEFRQSNSGEMKIESFDPAPAVVGQSLSIIGRGFSPNKAMNRVRILGAGAQYEALITEATASLLTVLIPFGSESGQISVNNLEGAGNYTTSPQNLAIKTSVSGAFKDTASNKIKGMKVKVTDTQGRSFTDTTNDDGVFVIPGLAAGLATIELDGGMSSNQLPYPQVRFKTSILADRDNSLAFPGTLQAINGTPSSLNSDGSPQERSLRLQVPMQTASSAAPDKDIRNGEVVLNLPDNAVIAFPDGRPVGQITLSLVARSLTPVALPQRHFSQTIVMISPLGATITPGAKLTFPNSDGFPANAQAELFRFNQRDTDTLGEFVSAGTATVSADGKTIETPANAIKETTYYFASILRPTVTVTGSVVETGQLPLPVRGALMGSRGRSTMTDPNGNFSVRNVPFNANSLLFADGAVIDLSSGNSQAQAVADLISLEANYLRPTRVVSRKEKNDITPAGDGGSTSAGTIELGAPPANNPPLILPPPPISIKVGQSLDSFEFSVQVSASQTVSVSVSGVRFASVTQQGGGVYKLTGTPTPADIGNYTLAITAINNLGQTAVKLIPLTVSP